MKYNFGDTIIALATPEGAGAIGVIRLSGPKSIEIVDKFFFGKNLMNAEANTIHYGKIKSAEGIVLDECLASIFRAPRSYTKEDIVEISCHGSPYILKKVIELFVAHGARLAEPGEFTMRAFLNGQMDLSQAEAVADLIASNSQSQHEIAMKQMRGGFSNIIQDLRKELIQFASLIELENDFSEEDVEFADRQSLIELVEKIKKVIAELQQSFVYGNAIKEGIPVAIVGKPNVGKSTLLNALLNEDKAIISSIPGTTRDYIEDKVYIDGMLFRFIDTAGIRETADEVETIGIEKTKQQMEKASIVLYMDEIKEDHEAIVNDFGQIELSDQQDAIILLNKTDDFHACHRYDVEEAVSTLTMRTPTIAISAKERMNIDKLRSVLLTTVQNKKIGHSDVIVSNLRHFQALEKTDESLEAVLNGLQSQIPSDLLALDIRHALHYLGEISGEITTDDLLESIFSEFCIGK